MYSFYQVAVDQVIKTLLWMLCVFKNVRLIAIKEKQNKSTLFGSGGTHLSYDSQTYMCDQKLTCFQHPKAS